MGARATYGAQTTADEPQYLLTALSVAEDGDLDIADELAARRWRAFHAAQLPEQTRPLPGRRRLSPHDPLLPLLLALPVALGGWVGAKLALAATAGVLGAMLLWTAVRRFGVAVPTAAVAVGVFGASAPLAVYGTQVYPELPAAVAVTIAIAAGTGPLRRPGIWLLAGAIVALPWLAVKYAPVAAVLAGVAVVRLWRADRRGAAAGFAAGLAAAGVVFLVLHQSTYGGWTPYAAGDHFVGGELTVVGSHPNFLGRSQRLAGLLVGRSFGIAAWQPAWLLAVPALATLARARPPWWLVLALPLTAGWLNATFVALTAQGHWFPGRQVVVVLPCAVLAVAWWADRLRAGRPLAALGTLGALGALGVLAYGWLVVEASTGRLTVVVDFFRTANPLYRAWRRPLPDYASPDAWTWPLHGVWVVVLLAVAVWGWRAGRHSTVNSACMPSAKCTMSSSTMLQNRT